MTAAGAPSAESSQTPEHLVSSTIFNRFFVPAEGLDFPLDVVHRQPVETTPCRVPLEAGQRIQRSAADVAERGLRGFTIRCVLHDVPKWLTIAWLHRRRDGAAKTTPIGQRERQPPPFGLH